MKKNLYGIEKKQINLCLFEILIMNDLKYGNSLFQLVSTWVFFFIFLSPAVRFYYEIYHTKMFVLFFIETYFKKYFYQNDLKL